MADLRTPFVKMPSTDSVTLPSTPPARQKLPRFKYFASGHLQFYDPLRVHWFDVINLRGTVLFHPGMWIQFLVLCLLATSIIVPSRTSNFDTSKWGEHITQATTLLNTLTVFLLGFFTSTVVNRWLAVRDVLGIITGRINDLGISVVTFLPEWETHGQEVRGDHRREEKLCELLLRYCNLSHYMMYAEVQQRLVPRDAFCMDHMIQAGVMTPQEGRTLQHLPSRYAVVLSWVTRLLTSAAEEGRVRMADTTIPMMHTLVLQLRGAGADLFKLVGQQLPYPYTHLLTIVTKLALVFYAFQTGRDIASNLGESNHQGWVVVSVVLLGVINMVYQGLLHIHAILYNPFRDHPAHFSVQDLTAGSQQFCAAVLDPALHPAASRPPPM